MNRRFQGSGGKTSVGNTKFIEGIPDNWKEVSVGSTEEFQGQERRIIIMTTVRSQPDLLQHDFRHKLGFLRNPKRYAWYQIQGVKINRFSSYNVNVYYVKHFIIQV